MTRISGRIVGVALAAVLLITGAAPGSAEPTGPTTNTQTPDPAGVKPMIFVHGGLGSGQQFESQALRFASNGYPAGYIEMFEHDSLAWPDSQDEVWSRLDQHIDDLLTATGEDQVYLLGHSQGTGVVQGYLNSDPDRAANVAKYVNLDGGSGGSVPDSVETLAIWGEGQDRSLPGATNVTFPGQSHTEVVNSPESFETMFEFLAEAEPQFLHVVREPADEITVSGRVQLFPANIGPDGATLSIYEIDVSTGERIGDTPDAVFDIDGSGDWGPFDADGEAFYEFAITRPDSDATHHVYMQRFVRSSNWVRVLTSEPGGLAESFWEYSDDHANMVIFRNKEWWGDQGDLNDALTINGEGVLNEVTSPRSNRTIGIFVHDAGLDQVSDVNAEVPPQGIPFLTGIDLFVPAADPPDGTVAVQVDPRLGDGPETICIPNRASTAHRSSLQFASYHHLLNPDGTEAEGHANPECAPAAQRPDPDPGDGDPPPPATPPPATPVRRPPAFTG